MGVVSLVLLLNVIFMILNTSSSDVGSRYSNSISTWNASEMKHRYYCTENKSRGNTYKTLW